jgi:pyruvate dehydrogenase E1 component alpha subunit
MVRIRLFEERVAELLENKAVIRCPVHLYTGQEAVAVGVCAHLRKEDYVFSNHRSHGHFLAKGGDMKALMAELYGKETGCSKGQGGSMHLASANKGLPGSSAIVGGIIPIAVGAALAFRMQKRDNVAVAFFGDGATNEGVFYEALNLAALMQLPVVFVCENNLYSTHMPVSRCLADARIYKKAEAAGLAGIRINGNDVIEVYQAAEEAISAARSSRPILIECMTYRWRGHVGPNYDLDKGLRDKDELQSWMKRCPIRALEKSLLEQGLISEADKDDLYKRLNQEIEEAISFAKEAPYPEPSQLLAYVFKG